MKHVPNCPVGPEMRVLVWSFLSPIWATSWQIVIMTSAPSEYSDQPGHPPSLISLRCLHKKHWVLSYPLSALPRLWSDWADAQADLSLRWVHRSFCWFYHEAAHTVCANRKTQARLWGSTGLSEPSLFAYVINALFTWSHSRVKSDDTDLYLQHSLYHFLFVH